MGIGSNIKKIRELRNYTQSYVANELGMSVPGYSKIENDKIDITISRIKSIAKILDTDLGTILNFDPKNVFHQYNNHHSVITGYNHQLNLNGSVDRILANIQSQIDELKKQNG
jgi:transcriptional regulator with XRE-family HTH domain